MGIREDAATIAARAIESVCPERGVEKALEGFGHRGNIVVLAVGKAAWGMARAARRILGERISTGMVITKYGHSSGSIEGLEVFEAGHPVPDENGLDASARALAMVAGLGEGDLLLLLVSGGGSSLFEVPAAGVELRDLRAATERLLRSGAAISEVNMVRKHVSAVKGGRLAEAAKPALVLSLVLSDVLGDRLDAIASGPACPDPSTSEDALKVLEKYRIPATSGMLDALGKETPKSLDNVEAVVVGDLGLACEAARETAETLGYRAEVLTTTLDCEAREAGAFLAAVARELLESDRPLRRPCALILGGETVVHVRGQGLGGRNQELALSAACGIDGLSGVVIASVGTDGGDGPTDAAGGMVDGGTLGRLRAKGVDVERMLEENDSYHALDASGDLVKTGPTGTNVNDLIMVLCR